MAYMELDMLHGGSVVRPADLNVSALMMRWCGKPSKGAVPAKLGVALSRAPVLVEWLDLMSRWPDLLDIEPRFSAPERVTVDGDRLVFMRDDGGDWLWSCSLGADRTLYERKWNEEWSALDEDAADFLLHLCLVKLVGSSRFGRLCTDLPNQLLPRVLAPMTRVAFGNWRWPRAGHSIYISESLMSQVSPALDREDLLKPSMSHSSVWLSGTSEDVFDYLRRYPGVRWIDVSTLLNSCWAEFFDGLQPIADPADE
jgi:hypothetical protein